MDITAVKQALADAASVIPGLQCHGYLPDAIDVPALCVADVTIEQYHATFGGHSLAMFDLRLYVSRANDETGQAQLDGYLSQSGGNSIKAALEADTTLGGIVQNIMVVNAHGWGHDDVADTNYYGCQFDVRVIG